MPRYPHRIWLAALLVAWSVDFLFWGKPGGVSFLIFAGLILAALFALGAVEGVRPGPLNRLLAGLVLLLAGVLLFRNEPFTRFFNGFLALACLGLFTVTFTRGGWVRFRLLDYLWSALSLAAAGSAGAFGLRFSPPDQQGGARSVFRRMLPVVRGLALAVPIVFVFGALLASADLIFADQLNAFLKAFDLDRLPEYIFRLVYISFLAFVFAGVFRHALYPLPWLSGAKKKFPDGGTAENSAGEAEKSSSAPSTTFLGATESFIVLGSVDLLFAFFVSVQFRYFFGGQANITAAGYTYSEYARRGFFELVVVAVITLLLYLALDTVTRRRNKWENHIFTGISVILVGLVLVMLVSAFQRLLLYESAYGFTNLRMYTHIFIPWLGFLLLATIILQMVGRERFFGTLLLLTAVGFAFSLAVMNIEALIVRQNVERARAGAELDAEYLAGLSDDGLSATIDAYYDYTLPQDIKSQLGAVLSCRVYRIGQEEQPVAWQSYRLVSALARQRLARMNLSDYSVKVDRTAYVEYEGGVLTCPVIDYID